MLLEHEKKIKWHSLIAVIDKENNRWKYCTKNVNFLWVEGNLLFLQAMYSAYYNLASNKISAYLNGQSYVIFDWQAILFSLIVGQFHTAIQQPLD